MSYAFNKDAKDGDTVTLENGVTYQYEVEKDRWLVKSVGGKSVDGKRKDFIPQLKGSFQIDGDGKAVIPDNAFYISEEDNEDGYKDEIRYPGVWWTGRYYEPKKLTHLLVGQSRYVEGVNEDGEYVYDELMWTKQFYPGDIIRVSASAHELYHEDASNWRDETDHYAQRSDDVWRVTKVLDIAERSDYPNPWGFRAYELERIVPEDQYSDRWYVGEDEGEDDWFDKYFSPVSVTNHYIEKETQPFLHFKQKEQNGYFTRGVWQGLDSGKYIKQNPKDIAMLRFSELDFLGSDVTVATWSVGDTIVLYEEDAQVASFVATNIERVSSSGYCIQITVDQAQTTGDADLNPEVYLKTPNPAAKEDSEEFVKKTGDKMSGDLEMVKSADGVESKIHTRWIDSSENSNLHIQHDGNTRIYVGRDEVSFTRRVQLNQEGVDENHAVTKGYVDNADRHLHTLIDELEQEIDVIAPRLESASYTYVSSPSVKPGEMHVVSGSFTSGTDVILFNDVALDGKTHTWAALNEGDYLEITDTQETRTAENYAMYLVTKSPEGTGMKQIEVALVKGQGIPTTGDVMDAKGFQLGGNDINDLDARYALKNHTHEELEGGVIITPLEFLRLSGGQYVNDDQIKGLTAGGSPTSGSAYGLDIPWAWFENNYPDIIGWVDDGGQAKHGNSIARLTVNKGGNRPGLTVMGAYALSYADVVIPGFVIRVDKIEEPQWGHKWP